MEPSRGIGVVVWGLGGESGVDSDGEANRRESFQCFAERRERRNLKAERKRHTDTRAVKNVCQTKMRINLWPIRFYCLFPKCNYGEKYSFFCFLQLNLVIFLVTELHKTSSLFMYFWGERVVFKFPPQSFRLDILRTHFRCTSFRVDIREIIIYNLSLFDSFSSTQWLFTECIIHLHFYFYCTAPYLAQPFVFFLRLQQLKMFLC